MYGEFGGSRWVGYNTPLLPTISSPKLSQIYALASPCWRSVLYSNNIKLPRKKIDLCISVENLPYPCDGCLAFSMNCCGLHGYTTHRTDAGWFSPPAFNLHVVHLRGSLWNHLADFLISLLRFPFHLLCRSIAQGHRPPAYTSCTPDGVCELGRLMIWAMCILDSFFSFWVFSSS